MTEWVSRAYGREYDLDKLNRERNDLMAPKWARKRADRAYQAIVAQISNRPLMQLRSSLIAATKAGDQDAIAKIELQMRDMNGEVRETGY